jgi:DNA protecting protein DprA
MKNEKQQEKEYLFWLSNIEGIGAVTIDRLILKFGNAKQVYFSDFNEIKQSGILSVKIMENFIHAKKNKNKIMEIYHDLEKYNTRFITIYDNEYPGKLKNIYSKPYGIYVKGNLPDEKTHNTKEVTNKPSVAIIGARACTAYGLEIGNYLAKELAKYGVEIVSGMAYGIDAAAGRGAIESGGRTYAVLGSGVNICYPQANQKLYNAILNSGGGIISEQPMNMPPLAKNFPMRNRIISGLADCIIVVEAKQKSGTLITVDLGLEQGKDIFVVPGRINDLLSEGCNKLISMGAMIITSVDDILNYFGLNEKNKKSKKIVISLAPNEKLLYSCLNLDPKHIEVIAVECELSIIETMNILTALVSKGIVDSVSGSYYFKKYS